MTTITETSQARQAFEGLLDAYKAEQHHLLVEANTEEATDATVSRMMHIERQMWQTPAADLRAVLVKMEIANNGTDMPPPDATASIIADLRRLSGETVSPIFQPDLWLIEWEARGGSYIVRNGEAIICGDPSNLQQRRLTREMEKANGAETVKAMIVQCCKGLTEEAAA